MLREQRMRVLRTLSSGGGGTPPLRLLPSNGGRDFGRVLFAALAVVVATIVVLFSTAIVAPASASPTRVTELAP
jgi:hypothetical protein